MFHLRDVIFSFRTMHASFFSTRRMCFFLLFFPSNKDLGNSQGHHIVCLSNCLSTNFCFPGLFDFIFSKTYVPKQRLRNVWNSKKTLGVKNQLPTQLPNILSTSFFSSSLFLASFLSTNQDITRNEWRHNCTTTSYFGLKIKLKVFNFIQAFDDFCNYLTVTARLSEMVHPSCTGQGHQQFM